MAGSTAAVGAAFAVGSGAVAGAVAAAGRRDAPHFGHVVHPGSSIGARHAAQRPRTNGSRVPQ